jgi:formylglycine-generating enzyme required for sulfatase activity/tRNA A-37 threonylcarbamoyl transferase component Bud32
MSSKGNSRYKEVYILKNPNYSIKIKPFDKPKKGGEGEIYQVLDSPLVAKIYYEEKLKPDHQKKLPILLETAEKLTIPKRNSFQIAWCVDLVYDSPKRNRIIGFLMQFVPGEKIVKAYNPQERQKYFPHFNYGYLHQIAINLAKVFQEIHKHNIVMGDVNESNFLVTDYAEVILIDIDSVQIYDTRESKHYKCTVGTTGYKPPELESYERVRKPEHDLYGLGVLIYKLLMGGMDPFPEVEGEKSSVYKHPRLALPFETLHPQVRYLMQLFTNDGYKNPQKRPTAESWVLALQEAEQSLKRCSNNERHYYQQHLQKCIWCERAWELKKDTFLPKLGYKFYDPTKTPPPPTPRPTPRPTPPPTPRPTPRPYIPITSRSTSRPTSISTPQRNIPIPSSSKILVQNNKTRRQILILGGLAGSGLVAAALTRNLWEQLFSKSIPTSQPIPKTTPEKNSISEAIPSPTPPPRPKIPIQTFSTVRVNSKGDIISRSQGKAEVMTENIGNGVSLEMVKIPGGRFLMGSPETEAKRDDEGPQHYVNVPEFFMGKYTVTQAQWQAVMGNNPSYFKGKNRPVERVSWNDATEFCQKLSKKTGRDYRLPSEAEWEYACRGGTTTPFYFGETITPELVNYNGRYTYGNGPKGKYRGETTDVGNFPPNSFGLYDMHGNVWEFCQDVWHDNYDGAPVDGSAWLNGGNSSHRVCRGGSWFNYPRWCRSADRIIYLSVETGIDLIGFRLVSFPPRTLE